MYMKVIFMCLLPSSSAFFLAATFFFGDTFESNFNRHFSTPRMKEADVCCPEHPDGPRSSAGCLPLTWWTWRAYGEGVDDEQREAVLVSDEPRQPTGAPWAVWLLSDALF